MSIGLEQESRPAEAPTSRHGAAPPWLARVLVESTLIIFSVLLALALDQWLENRERTAAAQAALVSIQSELEANIRSVERARENHRAIRDSLVRYASLNEALPPRVYLGGIFNPAPTYAVAWESARETGVLGDLSYELVLELSRVHAEQSRYRQLADALVQDIMMQIRREGAEPVLRDRSAGFISLQEDFANREQHLVAAYRAVLARLSFPSDESSR